MAETPDPPSDGAFFVLWPINDDWRIAALTWAATTLRKKPRNMPALNELVQEFVSEYLTKQPPPSGAGFNEHRKDAVKTMQQLRLKAKRAKKRKAKQ